MNLKTIVLGAIVALAFAPASFAGRGTDGEVKIIYWQAPSILNPYLSNGTKDIESSSLIIEPLARYNQDGAMVPYLVTSIPTLGNGGVSADQKSITWNLDPAIVWSDGTPLTSADVKFTYDYCMDPNGGCANTVKFNGVTSVDTPDASTVVITLLRPHQIHMPHSLVVKRQSYKQHNLLIVWVQKLKLVRRRTLDRLVLDRLK